MAEPRKALPLAGLRERWWTEPREMRAYLDTLVEETLNGRIHYVILHATQHRSEAAALLTRYGQSPGDFDFTLFLNERALRKS